MIKSPLINYVVNMMRHCMYKVSQKKTQTIAVTKQRSALSWVFKFHWQLVTAIVCVYVFFDTPCIDSVKCCPQIACFTFAFGWIISFSTVIRCNKVYIWNERSKRPFYMDLISAVGSACLRFRIHSYWQPCMQYREFGNPERQQQKYNYLFCLQ